ncbi:MAG: hypothetical protein K2Z81_08745 [Cyanobacteria bacterium]|nr:hypothetical protein [Cyanobacteriota bacterium]
MREFYAYQNVLRQAQYLQGDHVQIIVRNYNGELLHGLSLIYWDDNGKDIHLLAELPKILGKDMEAITGILNILLKTYMRGKLILNVVKEIAEDCGEDQQWYSDILLRELEISQPPWA